MHKYELNEQFKELESFLLHIKEHFQKNGATIHKARNEIKVIEHNGKKYVVKSFKIPSSLKALYYAKNASKAKRSYEYSLKLGDLTPQPIGYIEFYENDKLQESFYISEYFSYDWTMKEVLREPTFVKREEVLRAFAHFTSQLHAKGVLHLDYSAGNILIKHSMGKYIFKIVDVNRMKFKKELDFNERMKNFDMLWAKKEYLVIIAQEYARINNFNEQQTVKKALYYAFLLKLRKNFKKLLKGKIKNIDW